MPSCHCCAFFIFVPTCFVACIGMLLLHGQGLWCCTVLVVWPCLPVYSPCSAWMGFLPGPYLCLACDIPSSFSVTGGPIPSCHHLHEHYLPDIPHYLPGEGKVVEDLTLVARPFDLTVYTFSSLPFAHLPPRQGEGKEKEGRIGSLPLYLPPTFGYSPSPACSALLDYIHVFFFSPFCAFARTVQAHTGHCLRPSVPCAFTLLYARDVPATGLVFITFLKEEGCLLL